MQYLLPLGALFAVASHALPYGDDHTFGTLDGQSLATMPLSLLPFAQSAQPVEAIPAFSVDDRIKRVTSDAATAAGRSFSTSASPALLEDASVAHRHNDEKHTSTTHGLDEEEKKKFMLEEGVTYCVVVR